MGTIICYEKKISSENDQLLVHLLLILSQALLTKTIINEI